MVQSLLFMNLIYACTMNAHYYVNFKGNDLYLRKVVFCGDLSRSVLYIYVFILDYSNILLHCEY